MAAVPPGGGQQTGVGVGFAETSGQTIIPSGKAHKACNVEPQLNTASNMVPTDLKIIIALIFTLVFTPRTYFFSEWGLRF